MINRTRKKSSLNNSVKNTKQNGFSLIEIMVAALVLSIGILGVVSLQVVGLKGTHQSSMKVQAMTVVRSLTERMHANKRGVTDGHYVKSSKNFVCGDISDCSFASANCSSEDIAKIDLDNLICGYKSADAPRVGGIISNEIGDYSPFLKAELDISCPESDCTSGEIKIVMKWQEQRLGGADISTELPEKDSIVVNTRIFK